MQKRTAVTTAAAIAMTAATAGSALAVSVGVFLVLLLPAQPLAVSKSLVPDGEYLPIQLPS